MSLFSSFFISATGDAADRLPKAKRGDQVSGLGAIAFAIGIGLLFAAQWLMALALLAAGALLIWLGTLRRNGTL